MAGPSYYHVVRDAIRTTTGTQDFTIAGVTETPKGAIVTLVGCAADGTVESEARWSIGFTDGTNQYCAANQSQDNVADSNTSKSGVQPLAQLIKVDSTGSDVVGQISAFIAGGIRINWTAVDGTGHFCSIQLFWGDALQVNVGTFDMPDNTGNPNQTMDVTTPGFQPNVLFALGGPNPDIGTMTPEAGQTFSFGVGVEGTPKPATAHFAYTFGDAKATSTPSISVTDNSIIHRTVRDNASSTSLTKFTQIELDAFLSNGFRVKDITGTNPLKIGYMAILMDGAPEIRTITTPTTAGGTSVISHEHGGGVILQTMTDVINSADRTDDSAGQFGLGLFARNAQYSFAQHEEDAAATMNNGTVSDDVVINLPKHDGTTGLTATVTFGPTSSTFTFPDVLGTARLMLGVFYPNPHFTGSSALTLPRFQCAATGQLVFDAAAPLTIRRFSASAAGQLVFDAAAPIILRRFSASAAGELVFDASSALTLRRFTCAATGQLVFDATSALTLPRFQCAAADEEVFDTSTALTLPRFSTSASGELVFDAASTLTLRRFACAATGELVFDTTCAIVLPRFTCSAQGALDHDATCDIILPRFRCDATGELVFESTCSILLPHFRCEASDAALLGCIHDMQGSVDRVADLLGGVAGSAALLGSVDTVAELLGGSDAAVDLAGGYDAVVELRGANC